MIRPSICVKTSVWSYAFAEDAPESREATLSFFDMANAGHFELFVSEVVLGEIARAATSRRADLLQLLLAHRHSAGGDP